MKGEGGEGKEPGRGPDRESSVLRYGRTQTGSVHRLFLPLFEGPVKSELGFYSY